MHKQHLAIAFQPFIKRVALHYAVYTSIFVHDGQILTNNSMVAFMIVKIA